MLIIYKKDLETLCEFLIIKSIIPQVAKKTQTSWQYRGQGN